MANSHRVFNDYITFQKPGPAQYRYFVTTVGVVGNEVTFKFQSDCYGRLVDVHTLPENIGPAQDGSLATHVASINGVEFLVHKDSYGFIVGAFPPPNQPRREGSQSPTSSHGSIGSP